MMFHSTMDSIQVGRVSSFLSSACTMAAQSFATAAWPCHPSFPGESLIPSPILRPMAGPPRHLCVLASDQPFARNKARPTSASALAQTEGTGWPGLCSGLSLGTRFGCPSVLYFSFSPRVLRGWLGCYSQPCLLALVWDSQEQSAVL